jgi:uncharacterized OsmC-like protein
VAQRIRLLGLAAGIDNPALARLVDGGRAAGDRLPRPPPAGRPGRIPGLALGSCAATTLAMRAAAEGVPLARVEVVVTSESDHRGLLGLDQVPAGPLQLRVRYRLEAPGVPADRLRALVAWAERHSPVSASTRRALPMEVELDLGEAAAEG